MGDTAHVLEHPSGDGIKVTILPLGATITSVRVPDKHGNRGECVLGFDREEPYLGKNPFFGSVAGRVANRTATAEFELDGKRYELHANNGHHHLHGGKEGFDKKWWAVLETSGTKLTLGLRSPAGGGPRGNQRLFSGVNDVEWSRPPKPAGVEPRELRKSNPD